MRFNLTLSACALAAGVLLAGCGGGSDGDAGAPNPGPGTPPPSGQAALTPQNYIGVAQQVLSLNAFLVNSSDFVMGAQVETQTGDVLALQRIAQRQLLQSMQHFGRHSALATGVQYTETERCDNGGSITATVDDRNGNDEPDAGDSVTLTMRDCLEDGVLMNGQLAVYYTQVSGDPERFPFTLGANVQMSNFSVSQGQMRASGSGTLKMVVTARAPNDQSLVLSTPHFTSSASYGAETLTQTVRDYETTVRMTPAAGAYAANIATTVAGVLASSALESRTVLIATPEALYRSSTQRYPSRGYSTISGAGSSSVRITALDATSVRIELDADGNGSYELGETRRWSELF